MAVTKAMLMSN
jgi:hypothetical protein